MEPKILPEIRDAILRDIKNQHPQAFTHTDSDNYIRASATASAIEGNYQFAQYVLKQMLVTTADGEYLEAHGANYGIYRKTATAASGQVEFAGTAGSIVPIGTLLQLTLADDSNLFFTTTETATIDASGKAVAHAICQSVGVIGNRDANTVVQLSSAPFGVDSTAVLLSMHGGSEKESIENLRDRILDRKRNPPAGGNAHDYYVWAMRVDGVHKAFVYPLRRGLGTVDIVILGEDGLPSQETIKKCQQYIDSVRPVTAKNSVVIAPTPTPVNVSIQIKLDGSVTKTKVEEYVITTIKSYFDGFAPAQTFIKSQLETLISHVPGVFDRKVFIPVENVNAVVDGNKVEWLQEGNILVSFL